MILLGLANRRGCEYGNLFRQAPIKSAAYGGSVNTRDFRPFDERLSFATAFYERISSAISRLLLSGRPAAIAGGVPLLISYSVKTVLWCWPRPHVLKKSSEGIFPSFAYGNATGAVQAVVRALGIATAIEHRAPRVVFGRDASADARAMGDAFASNPRAINTPATPTLSIKESAPHYIPGSAALTSALPVVAVFPAFLRERDNLPTSNVHPSRECNGEIRCDSITFSHNFLLTRNSGQRRRGVFSASSPRFLRGTSIVAYCRMEAIYA